MQRIYRIVALMLTVLFTIALVWGADAYKEPISLAKKTGLAAGPIVANNYKWHKIGNIWNRVTNFSYMGDDAYQNRTPSGDYPGGSGNSYLYRGTIWLSAFVDGVFHSTQGDDHEFSPLDSVHVYTGPGARSEEDTYTRYYDVQAPLAGASHFPLGLEVTERTYAWSASYAADFIIYQYSIKNVGIDTDNDGYPDKPRGLKDFYFTIRFDADVSKLPQWGAEDKFSNQDDHAIANSQWNWVEYFPQMKGRNHGLTAADADSHLIIMFDGDNPNYPADNGQADDFGNPGADGKLQTPGFIGIKVLKTEPYLKPSSFHVCHIYNDPANDAETWTRMISQPVFEDLLVNPTTKLPFPHDYRGILTFGPLDTLAPGDSVVVTTALGIGCDFDSGGVWSLVKLVKIMDVAQFIVDNNYSLDPTVLAPAAPLVELVPNVVNNITTGVNIRWDKSADTHPNFQGYRVFKGRKTGSGSIQWDTLATYIDTVGSAAWPPPDGPDNSTYQFLDTDIIKGLVYYYSVQAFTQNITEPIPFGVVTTNIMDARSFKAIAPSNPVATSTLANVKVVPNPYIGSVAWNNRTPSDIFAWKHRLQFTNLPADAKVKIFTLDGDFVAEIEANKTVIVGEEVSTASPSVAEWDLMTRNNQEAAPGIYMFVVQSPTLGEKVGKFVIVR